MQRISTKTALALCALTLSACATHKDALLTRSGSTMLEIWQAQSAGGATPRALSGARESLRRPLTHADPLGPAEAPLAAYTRTAANEIYRQFQRLPNPDLVMYVFPHLAGADPAPVPGYSTVFPLYQRVQYAMPGERVENY